MDVGEPPQEAFLGRRPPEDGASHAIPADRTHDRFGQANSDSNIYGQGKDVSDAPFEFMLRGHHSLTHLGEPTRGAFRAVGQCVLKLGRR
jgi:hypothetical protein